MRARRTGARTIIENSTLESLKSNEVAERATQSAQGMIRTIRCASEERWRVKLDPTHSIWPWIAEHAGFLLTRFETGHDGKTAYERLEGEVGEGGHDARGWCTVEKEASGRPLGKLASTREDGMCLRVNATTKELIV